MRRTYVNVVVVIVLFIGTGLSLFSWMSTRGRAGRDGPPSSEATKVKSSEVDTQQSVELYSEMLRRYVSSDSYTDHGTCVFRTSDLRGEVRIGAHKAAVMFSRKVGYRWDTDVTQQLIADERTGTLIEGLHIFVLGSQTWARETKERPLGSWTEVLESGRPVQAVLLTGRAPALEKLDEERCEVVMLGKIGCGKVSLTEAAWKYEFWIDLKGYELRRLSVRPTSKGSTSSVATSGFDIEFEDAALNAPVDGKALIFNRLDVQTVSESEWPQYVPSYGVSRK